MLFVAAISQLTTGPGDSYASPGMLEFASLIEGIHDGIFVHSVYISDELDKDRQAGFVRSSRTSILALYSDQKNSLEMLMNKWSS